VWSGRRVDDEHHRARGGDVVGLPHLGRAAPDHRSLTRTLASRMAPLPRRRLAAGTLALAVVAAGCSGDDEPGVAATTKPSAAVAETTDDATVPPGTATGEPSDPSAPAAGPLEWSDCDGGFECSTLVVPLDDARPADEQISLALIRRPARTPSERIGSLAVNFGGPGAPGVAYLRLAYTQFPAEVRDRFDIVSFDPRGTGESAPVDCEADDAAIAALDGDPDTPAEVAAAETLYRALAEGCVANHGDRLAHLGTADAARDLERIRAALGEEQLTYVGYSYGSELGFAYATMFPDRIRAFVLDGAVDQQLSTEEMLRVDAEAFERALQAFFAECESRRRCGLGDDPEAAVREVLDRLETGETLPADDGDEDRTLHIGEAQTGMLAALYDREFGWPLLEQAVVEARHGDGTTLLLLSDTFTDYQGDGRYGNLLDANLAITCADEPERPTFAEAGAFADELGAQFPFWGRWIGYGLSACTPWPPAGESYDRTSRAPGAPPILVVGTTGDPATPYEQTAALAEQISSGVLLTYEGEGHTAYGGKDDCVDDTVNDYLIDLAVPPAGTTC
jgi:pimeloyl-ACP methyl ester carboxylesterase